MFRNRVLIPVMRVILVIACIVSVALAAPKLFRSQPEVGPVDEIRTLEAPSPMPTATWTPTAVPTSTPEATATPVTPTATSVPPTQTKTPVLTPTLLPVDPDFDLDVYLGSYQEKEWYFTFVMTTYDGVQGVSSILSLNDMPVGGTPWDALNQACYICVYARYSPRAIEHTRIRFLTSLASDDDVIEFIDNELDCRNLVNFVIGEGIPLWNATPKSWWVPLWLETIK